MATILAWRRAGTIAHRWHRKPWKWTLSRLFSKKFIMGYSQVGEGTRLWLLHFVGSSPTIPANKEHLFSQVLFVGWDSSNLAQALALGKSVGSHSPPEDRRACSPGAGRANIRRRRKSNDTNFFMSDLDAGTMKTALRQAVMPKSGDFERFLPP